MKKDHLVRGRAPEWFSGPVRVQRRSRIHWLSLLVALLMALALRQVSRASAEVQGIRAPDGADIVRRIGSAVLARVCSPETSR